MIHFRVLACFYIFVMAVLFTSTIGEVGSCAPVTWEGAMRAIAIVAGSVMFGFFAGYEHKEQKK